MNLMRAWVLDKPGKLVLKQVETPAPASDEVLVKIDGMCICNGSDPGIYHGHEAYSTPMIFGHEASGHIIQMGADVTGFSLGQRVCWWCTMGAFAEYTTVAPDKIAMFVVPPNVTREQAPVLELIIAASRALMPLTESCAGKTLAILGLGPSGLTAVQYAKALGFKAVYGWDLYPMRRERALSLGANSVYDPGADDFDQQIHVMPEVDIALDMMGDELLGQNTFTKLLRKVRRYGTVVTYGHPEHGRTFMPFVFQSRSLTMISPENDYEVIRKKGDVLMEFINDGRIKIEPMITGVSEFDDLGQAFEILMKQPGADIKLIFLV